MAQVTLTDYEIEHHVLPAVCARCGEPAAGRVELKLRVIDGWRGIPAAIGLFVGLFFFPPLVLWTLYLARVVRLRVPHCPAHRREYVRAARTSFRVLLPTWTAVAVVLDAGLVVEAAVTGTGVACCGLTLVPVAAALASGLVERRLVRLSGPRKPGLRLTNCHPGFVAAVLHDRARDRVDNPDRRGGFGDARDDYDDGPD